MQNEITCTFSEAGRRPGREPEAVRAVHRLFEAQVARSPDAIAATDEDRALTYRELDRRANQLARALSHEGVCRGDRVAICLDRSVDVAIAILGVLKTGAAYVPLDPAYPRERVDFMVEDAGVQWLVTQSAHESRFRATVSRILLDTDPGVLDAIDPAPLERTTLSEDVAYVMYTSGSTGTPKGVLVTHGGVVNHNRAIADLFRLGPQDRVAQCTSLSFDISVEELFPTWHRGGTVVFHRPGVVGPGPEFCRWIERERISVVDLPTAFWHEWVSHVEEHEVTLPRCLRLVVVGGQKASARALETWERVVPDSVAWINGYGPTETTVATIFFARHARTPRWDASCEIPIGLPIPGTTAHILDAEGRPCAIGQTGELYIGGAGVARGYLGRPELTAERFVPDPFAETPRSRMYRTGDLARRRADGLIEFAGRLDEQLKIRGFRIEPGEIEAHLRQHPLVRDAVVVGHAPDDREARLIAYVVAASSGPELARTLRDHLAQRLPVHMVPSEFVRLDVIPLTVNGKVDKASLPIPERDRSSVDSAFVAPATDTERELARIWTDVLGIRDVGSRDNFFELGGHSLRAVQVAARIRQVLGSEVELSEIFLRPTIAELAARIDETSRAPAAPGAPSPSIPRADRSRPLPLSFSQERVWFLQALRPESLAYHFQTLMRFEGPLDIGALEASLADVVARHEIFRTTFHERDGVPFQQVHGACELRLPVIDLRGTTPNERDSAARAVIEREMARRFDLAQLPLVRWTLLRTADEVFELLHVEHHIVHDGWSFNVFRHEMLQGYRARVLGEDGPGLPAMPIQFADYAAWERGLEGTPAFSRQLDYWKEALADPPVLDLPFARARPAEQSFRGALIETTLPHALYTRLRRLSEREGVTLYMTLLAGFFVLLHRCAAQNDLTVGAGVANRRLRETEPLIGMLVNNVTLRSRIDGDPTFTSFLAQVRKTTLDAYQHQDVPFDQVARALSQRSDRGRNPLFQTMFSFHDSPLEDPELPGVRFSCLESLGNGSAKFDLNVVAVPHAEQRSRGAGSGGADGITLLWEFSIDLFERSVIERMSRHYETLLQSIVDAPASTLHSLEMLDPVERRRVLVDWNRTSSPYPPEPSVQALFEAQAQRTPDAVALVEGARRITYREVSLRADAMARGLLARGTQRGTLIAIAMERCADLVISMLAILRAGGAYVPLDLGWPDARIEFLLEDTAAAGIVTSPESRARTGRWSGSGWRADASELAEAQALEGGAAAFPDGDPSDLAYVMYTSGSTGRPKGVEIPHRGIVRLVWGLGDIVLDSSQRILHLAPAAFDASTLEVWGALLRGGTCVLAPPGVPTARELATILAEQRITTLWLTCALFNAIVDEMPEALAPVRQLLTGGDALSVEHVRRARQVLPDALIVNGYGPTEGTTFTCCHVLRGSVPDDLRSIPIGRPIGNTRVYVLDPWMNPVPAGIPGELFIAGDGLARGYLRRPELTAERFVPDPFGAPGERLYRTGDRVRHLDDGAIEFLGRNDDQLKIRGFRVELGEIEAAIRALPSVRNVAVKVDGSPGGERRLAAYVVLDDEAGRNGVDEIRSSLARVLPEAMIPSWFIGMKALPVTSNGKVDRAALPAPDRQDDESARPVAKPHNDVQGALHDIWRDVLGVQRLSIDDNFFAVGGHSLMAIRLMSRIRDELGVELPLRILFEHPTISSLAAQVATASIEAGRARRATSPWRYLVELNAAQGTRPVFFLPGGHGSDQEFLVYARLVHHCGSSYRFVGMRARSADGIESAHESVEAMAADYLAEIRQMQPAGPYLLVGNCIGGVVAFEVARQIEQAGESVGALVLMDTDFPTSKVYARHLGQRMLDALDRRWQAKYYLRRLAHHREQLARLSGPEKLRYAFGRAATAVRDPVKPDREFDPADLIRAGYVETLRRYRPGRYRGPLTLILCDDGDPEVPVRGWRSVTNGPLEVRVAPGDHESYIRAHVRQTGALLQACLDNSSPPWD